MDSIGGSTPITHVDINTDGIRMIVQARQSLAGVSLEGITTMRLHYVIPSDELERAIGVAPHLKYIEIELAEGVMPYADDLLACLVRANDCRTNFSLEKFRVRIDNWRVPMVKFASAVVTAFGPMFGGVFVGSDETLIDLVETAIVCGVRPFDRFVDLPEYRFGATDAEDAVRAIVECDARARLTREEIAGAVSTVRAYGGSLGSQILAPMRNRPKGQ